MMAVRDDAGIGVKFEKISESGEWDTLLTVGTTGEGGEGLIMNFKVPGEGYPVYSVMGGMEWYKRRSSRHDPRRGKTVSSVCRETEKSWQT
jgi:hypothetical protein